MVLEVVVLGKKRKRKGRRAVDGHRINGRLSFIYITHVMYNILNLL